MRVYRDYTQRELELQYDSAARAPALQALRDAQTRWTEAETARARAGLRCRLDIPYGTGPREAFDLFFAEPPSPPLLVFIHGGYWKSRDKGQFGWIAPPFVARGIAVAALGYPLCPEVRLTEVVEACRRGLSRIHAMAGTLGFDAGAIHVAGHSAGGHLCAMMLATDWSRYGAPADLVKSATAVSGIYDLTPLGMVAVHADLKLDHREVETLSPLRLSPRVNCPLAITVGAAEAAEFVRNATELAAAWRSRGVPVSVFEAPGFHHFDILNTFTTPGDPLFDWVCRQAGR